MSVFHPEADIGQSRCAPKSEPRCRTDAITAMSREPEVFDKPTAVSARDGEVILDGPDGWM